MRALCGMGLMEAYEVNRAVNSVRNDTEQCIEPLMAAIENAARKH